MVVVFATTLYDTLKKISVAGRIVRYDLFYTLEKCFLVSTRDPQTS